MTETNKKNNSFYNPEMKNAFLETISNEGSAKNYARIFRVTSKYEEALGKDLNEFSFEDLEKILYGFQAQNRNTVETYGRIISSYLNWCVQQGFSKENPLTVLRPEDFDKYVAKEEYYLTEKQLCRYEDQCANYQDAVILRLLFEGVGGRTFSEITNLKASDVDFENNMLRLRNSLKVDKKNLPIKFSERIVKVSDRTLHLIKGAIEQKIYLKRNGFMSDAADNVREYTDLVDNEYVIRPSITKNEYLNSPADKFVIYRRIQTISETLGIDGLTATLIQRSGMIYMLNDLVGDSDKVTLDDVKIIADRFNVKSYHNLRSFLTIENVRKTYPRES